METNFAFLTGRAQGGMSMAERKATEVQDTTITKQSQMANPQITQFMEGFDQANPYASADARREAMQGEHRRIELQKVADTGTVGDVITDSAIGVAGTAASLPLDVLAGQVSLYDDPIGTVSRGVQGLGQWGSEYLVGDKDTRTAFDEATGGTFQAIEDFVAPRDSEMNNYLNEIGANGNAARDLVDSLRNASGFVSDLTQDSKSDSYKATQQLRKALTRKENAEVDAGKTEDDSWVDKRLDNIEKIGNAFGNYGAAEAIVQAVETTPYMLAAAKVSKKLQDNVAQDITKKQTAKLKESDTVKAGKEASKEVQRLSGVAAENVKTAAPNVMKGISDLKDKNIITAKAAKQFEDQVNKGITKNAEKGASDAAWKSTAVANGVLEGSSNATQVYNDIVNTDPEELKKTSPKFVALLEGGMDEEDAQKEIARQAASGAFVTTGLASMGASAVTGGVGEKMLNTPSGKNVIDSAKRTAQAGVSEGIEEGLQGGFGQVFSNIAKQNTSDTTLETGEGVEEAIGESIASGTLSSGLTVGSKEAASYTPEVIGATFNTLKAGTGAVAGAAQATKDAVSETVSDAAVKLGRTEKNPLKKDIAAEVATPVSKEDAKAGVKPEPDEFIKPYVEPAQAAQAALNAAVADPSIDNQIGAFDAVITMNRQVTAMKQEAIAAHHAGDSSKLLAMKGLNDDQNFYKQAQAALTMSSGEVRVADKIASGTATAEEMKSLKPLTTKILYSSNLDDTGLNEDGSVNQEYANALNFAVNDAASTEGISPEVIATAQAKLESLKAMDAVHSDIREGSKSDEFFRGAEQYFTKANELMHAGKTVEAQAEVDQFTTFAEAHIEKAANAERILAERKAQYPGKGNIDPGVDLTYTNASGKEVTHKTLVDTQSSDGKLIPKGTPFRIHKGSGDAVDMMVKEAKYLQSAMPFIQGITQPSVSAPTAPVTQGTAETTTVDNAQSPRGDYSQTEAVTDQAIDTTPTNTQGDLFGDVEGFTNAPSLTEEQVQEIEDNPNQGELDLDTPNSFLAQLSNKLLPDSVFQSKLLADVTTELRENAVAKFFKPAYDSITGQYANITEKLGDMTVQGMQEFLEGKVQTDRINHADKEVIRSFNEFKQEFDGKIRKKLEKMYAGVVQGDGKLHPTRRLRSPSLFLFDDNGQIPQRVVDGLALAGWNWMMYESNDAKYNSPEDINRIIHGNSDGTIVDPVLADAGMVKSVVTEYLGSMAMDTIGIRPDSNTPHKLNDALREDLAEAILFTLSEGDKGKNVTGERMGLIARTTVSNGELMDRGIIAPSQEKEDRDVMRSFVKLVADKRDNWENEDNAAFNQIRDIRDVASSESSRLTEKLGNPRYKSDTVFFGKPPAKVKTIGIQGSDRGMSPKAVESHNVATHRAYFPNENMLNFLLDEEMGLGEDFLRDILGYQEIEVGHPKSDAGRIGLNNTIDNAIKNAKGFKNSYAEQGKGTPVFFDFNFVSQTRHMMQGSFNPQREKLHRFMVGFEKDTVKINTKKGMRGFNLAIAQGLGLKTDKQNEAETFKQLEKYMTLPTVFKAAVEELRSGLNGGVVDPAIVATAVKAGKEKAGSFKALLTYAEYLEAKESGAKTFDTDIMYEIDGVANGPFHAQLQMGLANLEGASMAKLARSGVNKSTKRVNHNRKASTNDTYVHAADVVAGLMNKSLTAVNPAQRGSMDTFIRFSDSAIGINKETGALEVSRGPAKGVVTPVTYGSSSFSTNRGLFDQTLGHFYDVLDKHIRDAETDVANAAYHVQLAQAAIIEWQQVLATDSFKPKGDSMVNVPFEGKRTPIFTHDHNGQLLNPTEATKHLKEFEFNKDEADHMATIYADTFGKSFETAVTEVLGDVVKNGQDLIANTGMVHALHVTEVNQGVNALFNDSGSVFGPTRGEVSNVVSSFSHIAPSFRPFFTKTGDRDNYVQLSKRIVREGDIVGRSAITGATLYGSVPTFEDPGVKALPIPNIQIDAAVSMLLNLITDTDHMNVWDGFYVTPNNIGKMTKALNTADVIVNRDWDTINEFADQYQYVLANHPVMGADDVTPANKQAHFTSAYLGLNKNNPLTAREKRRNGNFLLVSGLVPAKVGSYGNESLGDIPLAGNSTNIFDGLLQRLRASGTKFAENKLEALKDSSYGQFVGTENDQILTDENGDVKGRNKATVEFEKTSRVSPRTKPEPLKTLDASGENAATQLNGKTYKGKDVSTLIDLVGDDLPTVDKKTAAVRKMLASTLKSLITDKTEVVFKDFEEVVAITEKNAYGAYLDGVVYVNTNPAIQMSSAKAGETILHELTHAVTADTVHAIMTGQVKGTEAQRKAINELEDILKWMVKSGVADPVSLSTLPKKFQDLAHMYYVAQTDTEKAVVVSELLAYGLTEEGVARTLSRHESKTTQGIMKRVMRALQRILGIKTNPSLLTDVFASFYSIATTYDETTSAAPTMYSNGFESRTQGIFDQLPEVDPETNAHLDAAIKEIDFAIISRLETQFPDSNNLDQATDQVLFDQVSPNVKTTANKLANAGFDMSDKEALVYQLYAEVLSTALTEKYHSKNAIRSMYVEAKAKLDHTIFLGENPTADEVLMAKSKFDAVFASTDPDMDILGNFAALAKTHKPLRDALNNLTVPRVSARTQSTFVGSVEQAIKNIYGSVVNKVTTTNSKNVLDRLDALSKRVAHVKARKAGLLESGLDKAATVVQSGDSFIRALAEKGRRKANANRLKNNGSAAIAHALNEFSRTEESVIQAAIKGILNLGNDKPLNVLQEFGQEITGISTNSEPLHVIKRTSQYQTEAKREDINKAVIDNINEVLNVSEEESASVTKLLRADISSLISGRMNYNGIKELLRDPAKLQAEIDYQVTELNSQPVSQQVRNFYINSAVGLGKYMATGLVYSEYQLMNAAAIASAVGTGMPTDGNTASATIDQLASLVALQEIDTALALEVMDREEAGMTHVIMKQNTLKRKAVERFGEGAAFAQTKGYMADILNPNKSVTYGSDKESKLESRGYAVYGELRADKNDPSTERTVYVSEDAGNIRHVSGAISTITSLVDGIDPLNGRVGSASLPSTKLRSDAYKILKAKKNAITALGTLQTMDKPVNAMIPSFNVNGTLSGFHYEMSHAEKDGLLERDNDVANILGAWDSRIEEEKVAGKFNKEIISALKDRFDNARGFEKKEFIAVSPNAESKRIRDLYYLMPRELREEVRKQFGTKTLYVHKEDLNNTLGYRELSVLQLWDAQDTNKGAQLLVTLAEHVMGKQAAKYLRKGERGLQELVSDVKDWIVVKSVVVSAGNIVSNMAQAKLRGVSWKDMKNDSIKALEAVKAYQKAQAEYLQVVDLLELENDPSKVRQLEVKANELTQEMQGNPVRELVDAGMLPSVVEDQTQQDKYSLKNSAISKFMQSTPFEKQPPTSVLKNLVITQDSRTYAFLNTSVEMGDFVAKFVMYNKYKKEGNTADKALKLIAKEFVDYSALSSREMDYLNKMGLASFFKFTMRMFPVVLDLIVKQPLTVLLFLLGSGLSGLDIASPLDALSPDLGAKTGLFDLLSGYGSHVMLPV